MPYVDLNTIHNPSTGTVPPAAWGDQLRENLEFLIDPPACSVFHNTSQSISSSTSFTVMAANSELFDNDSMHSTVTNNSRITIQTTGRYQVQAIANFTADSTGLRSVRPVVNGTSVTGAGMSVPAASGGNTLLNFVKTFVLVAGDYVEVEVRQNSGSSLTVTLSEFSATFITRA